MKAVARGGCSTTILVISDIFPDREKAIKEHADRKAENRRRSLRKIRVNKKLANQKYAHKFPEDFKKRKKPMELRW